MPEAALRLELCDEASTASLGRALGRALLDIEDMLRARGMAIVLQGELGAGKTTLVRAALRELGVQGTVKSPTYTLLEPYEVSKLNFYHFDFYRFKSPREFLDGGLEEYFAPGGVCLVEWPERAGEYLPPVDLGLSLSLRMDRPAGLHEFSSGRVLEVSAYKEIGVICRDRLLGLLAPRGAG